jgi:adenine-specific DNA-methyltransferase
MPTLNWIGKEKVVSHHQDVPYRVLEHKYGFTADNGDQTEPTNSGNKIIHGDNLEALKSLLPEYEGKVKCIYIDPPYNTGNEGWTYNDNVNHQKIKKWLDETLKAKEQDKVAAIGLDDLTRHDKWLCMMYPRLKLLQKLLDDNGAIFISIDDNEQANLKIICDEIFGIRNFVGTYFWYKSGTPPNLSHKIKRNIEYVLCYSKTSNSNKFQGVQKISKSDDPITKPQNSFKELRFKPKSLSIGLKDGIIKKGIYGTAKFPNELLNDLIIKNGTNENEVVFKNRFIWVQEKLNEELENGTLVKINSNSLVISYKKQNYAKEVPPNFIDSSVGVDTTENAGRMLEEIFGKKVFDFPAQELASFGNVYVNDAFGTAHRAHASTNAEIVQLL